MLLLLSVVVADEVTGLAVLTEEGRPANNRGGGAWWSESLVTREALFPPQRTLFLTQATHIVSLQRLLHCTQLFLGSEGPLFFFFFKFKR